MSKYNKEIVKLLRQLGVNGSYVGFKYTVYGIIITIKNPDLTTYVCKGLYVEIAVKFKTTIGCAERNIRTIINVIWNRGDRELLNKIFYKELKSKPRNAEFIDAMANYIENMNEEC